MGKCSIPLVWRVPRDKLAGLSRHLSGGAGGHFQSGDDDCSRVA